MDAYELDRDGCDRRTEMAALQRRVKELEAIKAPDTSFTYCAYCGERSPVDEHNEDLSEHIRVCEKHPMRESERATEFAKKALNSALAKLDQYETALKALPKVEGEIEVDIYGYVWIDRSDSFVKFDTEADAQSYAALLTLAQGVKG